MDEYVLSKLDQDIGIQAFLLQMRIDEDTQLKPAVADPTVHEDLLLLAAHFDVHRRPLSLGPGRSNLKSADAEVIDTPLDHDPVLTDLTVEFALLAEKFHPPFDMYAPVIVDVKHLCTSG